MGPVHVARSPLEEALLGNRSGLAVASVVEFILGLSEVGVIKVGSSLTLAHFYF